MPGRGLEPDRFGRGLREAVLEYAGGVRTFVGHGSIGTPGALAALATLSRRHGRLPWADLVEPAYQHARNGFALSYASHAYMSFAHESVFGWDEPSRAVLHHDDGSLVGPGETVRVPDLATSLRRIADHAQSGNCRKSLLRISQEFLFEFLNGSKPDASDIINGCG